MDTGKKHRMCNIRITYICNWRIAMSENTIRGLTIHPFYCMYADELEGQVNKNGPHWAMIIRPVRENEELKPGFKIACLGNGKWWNPVSKMYVEVNKDTWVQRFHHEAVQFDMSAVDAAICAASVA